MECRRELEIEFGVIFGQAMLAVGLLAHLDVGNWIAAFFDVRDFSGGIFRVVVKHGDGNHGGQAAGNAAGEEKIEAYLVSAIVDNGSRMPRIDGGADSVGLRALGGVMDHVVEAAFI